jgi:hypothetical protein
VIAHVSILALLILSTEVHPFQAVPSETIAVDLVTAAEAEKKPEPAPTPQLPPPDSSKLTQPSPQSAAPQQAPVAQPQQRQAARAAPREPAAAQPQPQSPPQTAQAASPPRGYTPPEPDITVKYHVMLGLPEGLSPPTPSPPTPSGSGDKPGDGADATASVAADISSSLVAEFRRRLKTCSKLPPTIDPTDEIEIKLRVFMTPEGRLAAEPNPIGVKHPSENGPALLQSAVAALQACQPYMMLPKERYGEWKVIDLTFTPQDFSGG